MATADTKMRTRLSWMWVFVMLNMLLADVLSYLYPWFLAQILAGRADQITITLGFLLLTLTLGTGFFFSEELFGKAVRFNHKTVFGVVSWFIFAALLVGRYAWGWRGRTALRWTLTGFVTLLLAYVGSMFVLEVILGKV